jgi:hypothetical protein
MPFISFEKTVTIKTGSFLIWLGVALIVGVVLGALIF